MKIEGRLLDDDDDLDLSDDGEDETEDEADAKIGGDPMDEDGKEKVSKASKTDQRYKFSHFFKSMAVEFERSRTKDGSEQSVEWKKPATPPNAANPPNAADFDQLEFKRGGEENVNISINLVRDETQERYQLSAALAEIMDIDEATRAEAVTSVWEYIQVMGLQEDDERRTFRCDDRLRMVGKCSKC